MVKPKNLMAPEEKFPGGDANTREEIDGLRQLLKRGAWVRSGATMIMWFFALAAYWIHVFDFFSFIGICFSILCLILINPLIVWILRHLEKKKHLEYFELTTNGLEVLAYTAIIYFAGGLNVSYLTLIYLALITYLGVLGPSSWPFIITGFCSFSIAAMVLLVYFHIIPIPNNFLNHHLPLSRQLFDVGIITVFLFLTAFISAYTSQVIRKGKKLLKEQNVTLNHSQEQLKQAGQILKEKNQALLEALTAMKKAQSSDRMKSEFLANMSHELRTPLNHIIGFSELLVDQHFGTLNPIQDEYLNDILQSSHHLLSLINDILDLSKIEAGKTELESSDVPFQNLLENSLVMIREKAISQRLQLQTYFNDLPRTIRGDERKLKQVLYNLLSNAVKFTPQGGLVCLAAKQFRVSGSGNRRGGEVDLNSQTQLYALNSDFVEISVKDSGIGIADSDRDRIFNPFEQGDNSATRKYQGTGLGLALSKQMVELHGGRIWAESQGPGKGSTFCIILPIKKALGV
jgi:signal transduction histidine kinase